MFKSNSFAALIIIGLFILPLSSHAQWVEKNGELPEFTATALDACSEDVAIINTNTGIFLTTNGGDHWTQLSNPPAAGIGDIDMTDSLRFWVGGYNGEICSTSDQGLHWTLQFSNPALTGFINSIEMFDPNHGVAMADGNDGINGAVVILKTEDGGEHWTSMNDSAFGAISYNQWRETDFIGGGTGYFSPAVTNDCVWKTVDFGGHWTKTSYATAFTPTVLRFYDENIGFVSTGADLARTLDGGDTWKYWNLGSPHTGSAIEFAPGDPSIVWMLGDNEVFFSNDMGDTWESTKIDGYGMSVNNQGVDMVFTDRNNGWLLSQKKIYKTANGGGFTDVAQMDSRQPKTFLYQNFPNPFNPSTTIRYALDKPAKVTLRIFDTEGRRVNTLVDTRHAAGDYETTWDATDETGNRVGSGCYFVEIVINGVRMTRKIALIQ